MREKKKKNISSLSEHTLYKKKGIIKTPFNEHLGDKMVLSSWPKERMPEYLWLGLILMHYGRTKGFERIGKIYSEISTDLISPKLSLILSLPASEQSAIYKVISNSIDNYIISPLTVLYRPIEYPEFNKYFNIPQIYFEERVDQLLKAIKIYYNSQGDEATDLRYLAIIRFITSGKVKIMSHLRNSIEALEEYPYTSHEDEKMRSYRPAVRSMENNDFSGRNVDFVNKFWRDIGMITKCKPMGLDYPKNDDEYTDFICNFQNILEYIIKSNKDKSLAEDKFDVIIGSVSYALKIFIEINKQSLGNSILGRHGIRTIIEILIIIKYLLKSEENNPEVWKQYKQYGISKYKLVLVKAREAKIDKSAHFIPPVAEALVNEVKWEEFQDIDLKYFDKLGIREKSELVQEKDLYDLYYDYDSSFVHGMWGAIRESGMLSCNNPGHQYHSIPDVYSNQTLPDVKADSHKIIKKIIELLTTFYNIPEDLLENIGN